MKNVTNKYTKKSATRQSRAAHNMNQLSDFPLQNHADAHQEGLVDVKRGIAVQILDDKGDLSFLPLATDGLRDNGKVSIIVHFQRINIGEQVPGALLGLDIVEGIDIGNYGAVFHNVLGKLRAGINIIEIISASGFLGALFPKPVSGGDPDIESGNIGMVFRNVFFCDVLLFTRRRKAKHGSQH